MANVTFKTGSYENYNNLNYVTGCLYYLTDTNGLTHIFLDGTEYAKWTASMVNLLESVFQHLVYDDSSTGQTSAASLIAILRGGKTVVSITATYTGGTKYVGDTISSTDFRVVATWSDSSTTTITDGVGVVISPTTLANQSNIITVTYVGVSTTVTVPATFNAPTAITSVSSTQTTGAVGTDVDTSAITYTIQYMNGDTVTMTDPNIITVSPTTIQSIGNNTITVALVNYPSITNTFTIVGQGEVTSATVVLEKRNYIDADTGSSTDRPHAIDITFSIPMTVAPNKITITASSALSLASVITSAVLTESGGVWSGSVYLGQNQTATTIVNYTGTISQSGGQYTGAKVGAIYYSATSQAQFRTASVVYTITYERV